MTAKETHTHTHTLTHLKSAPSAAPNTHTHTHTHTHTYTHTGSPQHIKHKRSLLDAGALHAHAHAHATPASTASLSAGYQQELQHSRNTAATHLQHLAQQQLAASNEVLATAPDKGASEALGGGFRALGGRGGEVLVGLSNPVKVRCCIWCCLFKSRLLHMFLNRHSYKAFVPPCRCSTPRWSFLTSLTSHMLSASAAPLQYSQVVAVYVLSLSLSLSLSHTHTHKHTHTHNTQHTPLIRLLLYLNLFVTCI
jgi:hypothetical protein